MRYIAIDPGVVTGVVCWGTDFPDTLEWHELDDLRDVARWVRARTAFRDDVTIVTEKFQISARTIRGKVFYDSLYFNGWLSIEFPDRIEQTPAQAKGFATDKVLKHLGWFNRTKDGHANDAARHLVYRLVKDREPHVIEALKGLAE